MKFADVILLEHLSGVCGMTHILKAFCCICACLLQQNLFTSWMLSKKRRQRFISLGHRHSNDTSDDMMTYVAQHSNSNLTLQFPRLCYTMVRRTSSYSILVPTHFRFLKCAKRVVLRVQFPCHDSLIGGHLFAESWVMYLSEMCLLK